MQLIRSIIRHWCALCKSQRVIEFSFSLCFGYLCDWLGFLRGLWSHPQALQNIFFARCGLACDQYFFNDIARTDHGQFIQEKKTNPSMHALWKYWSLWIRWSPTQSSGFKLKRIPKRSANVIVFGFLSSIFRKCQQCNEVSVFQIQDLNERSLHLRHFFKLFNIDSHHLQSFYFDLNVSWIFFGSTI